MAHGTSHTVRRAVDILRLAALAPPEPVSQLSIDVVNRRFSRLQRLPTHPARAIRRRVNMITDSINPPHLYGGVGTAIIFAALLAERLHRPLRVITRTDAGKPQNFAALLALAGIAP